MSSFVSEIAFQGGEIKKFQVREQVFWDVFCAQKNRYQQYSNLFFSVYAPSQCFTNTVTSQTLLPVLHRMGFDGLDYLNVLIVQSSLSPDRWSALIKAPGVSPAVPCLGPALGSARLIPDSPHCSRDCQSHPGTTAQQSHRRCRGELGSGWSTVCLLSSAQNPRAVWVGGTPNPPRAPLPWGHLQPSVLGTARGEQPPCPGHLCQEPLPEGITDKNSC